MAIASWLLVVFEVLTLTLAMTDVWPAWSNGRSNLGALAGKRCGLADYVMVEENPNAGMLTPVGAPVGDALGGPTTEGFGPNGIPSNVSADELTGAGPGTSSNFADSAQGDEDETSGQAGTEGGTTAAAGVNGSRARLPFSLDPARTPVMGSWRSGTQQPAVLRSAWYRLPADWSERDRSSSILVVSAAGRFDPGDVVVQWAADDGEPDGRRWLRRRGRATGLAKPAGTAGARFRPTRRRCGWSPPTTTCPRSTGSP